MPSPKRNLSNAPRPVLVVKVLLAKYMEGGCHMGMSTVLSSMGHMDAARAQTHSLERTPISPISPVPSDKNQTNQTSVPSQSQLKLSDEALAQIGKLRARDTKVRQHESAHLAAAGGLATTGASFTYQKGPDGVNYAIGGEVGIDVSPGRTPQDTIERAKTVKAAALAPADPSGPDLAVAAKAQQLEQKARAELNRQQGDLSKSGQDQAANVRRAYGTGHRTDFNTVSVFASCCIFTVGILLSTMMQAHYGFLAARSFS